MTKQHQPEGIHTSSSEMVSLRHHGTEREWTDPDAEASPVSGPLLTSASRFLIGYLTPTTFKGLLRTICKLFFFSEALGLFHIGEEGGLMRMQSPRQYRKDLSSSMPETTFTDICATVEAGTLPVAPQVPDKFQRLATLGHLEVLADAGDRKERKVVW